MKKDFEIKTERLKLVPLGLKYLESVHEYASDPLNTTYMLWLPNDTLDDTIGFLKGCDALWEDDNNPDYECAIILDGVMIGGVSLYVTDGVGEFGWILNRKYWNNGYLTEAAQALKEFAINELGMTHFIAHCDSENTGSYRVMEKIGMIFVSKEGGRRNKQTPPGEERFELLYELKL